MEEKVVIVGLADDGPAERANLRTGDVVLAVAGTEVNELPDLFRRIWSLGNAGVEVPLTIDRDGRTLDLRVASGDRNRFLKGPSLH
jgi:S1-C subfamily serine protease